MNGGLDAIEFLARSSNRVAALETLIDDPHDRAELQEAIDASSSTVGRVLDDLMAKGWVTKSDDRYAATRMGELVGREFARLLDAMEAAEGLSEVLDWLPAEGMDFDLTTLRDADITTSTRTNPFAPVLRMATRVGSADHVQLLAGSVLPRTLAAVREAVVEGTQTLDAVVAPAVLDAVDADSEMSAQVREIAAADRASVFRCDGDVPYDVAVADGAMVLNVTDEQGFPRALLEADHEAAVSRVTFLHESYRREAEPVGPERVAPNPFFGD